MTASHIVFDPALTEPDRLVLRNLDIAIDGLDGYGEKDGSERENAEAAIETMTAFNDPNGTSFRPTVFTGVDLHDLQLPAIIKAWILHPYITFARSVVRVPTDVVMVTHLLLYFVTSVPSAFILFRSFSWSHGLVHFAMQMSYVGTYTLMMHQHIHQRGILRHRFFWFDTLFPYITDPLMGHTWNSYFYHHVKHHHVEGNGPDDLSSTIQYQRDNVWHFLHYVGRFYFFIWLDLPLYFFRKGQRVLALKAAAWEFGSYAAFALLHSLNPRAAFMTLLLPFLLLRLGLMVGNWGQHAFVDHEEPNSDYRSSITLIDVASNRHCFNDGYHTSHHLNPLRHWREHPISFMKGKDLYASQEALVFHNIDFIMITVRLLLRDYRTLAQCMVPIGSQVHMTVEERMALLRSHVKRFTEQEIRVKFGLKEE